MIWLASFPRSGNTFFRNILFEVYGISSSTFHVEKDKPLDANWDTFDIVKTHELPQTLPFQEREIKSVYIIRDGRDALVSLAHYRKDITEQGSEFEPNLAEAICAAEGSYFGGWSQNVLQWIYKADIVIRYEDLLIDPIKEAEKLRSIIDLPQPDPSKLPSFQALKQGAAEYGSTKSFNEDQNKIKTFSAKNFRKGKAGSWKDEMPHDLHLLYWQYHGDVMKAAGYQFDGLLDFKPHPVLDHAFQSKLGQFHLGEKMNRILIDGNKLAIKKNDGIKRYLIELLKAYSPIAFSEHPEWKIDILISGEIYTLKDYYQFIDSYESLEDGSGDPLELTQNLYWYEYILMFFKNGAKKILSHEQYEFFAKRYRNTDIRKYLGIFRDGFIAIWKYIRPQKFYDFTEDYDVIHIPLPQNYLPFVDSNNPFVVTVHDLTHHFYKDFHQADNVRKAEKGMQFIADKNCHIIAVSESTKNDFLAQFEKQVPAKTIYEGVNASQFNDNRNEFLKEQVRELYNLPKEEFLLCLSTIEPRKNLKNTILAFKKLRSDNPEIKTKLVIVGKTGWKTEEVEAFIGSDDNISFTGYVKDVYLPSIYCLAYALCYVSHYEGFGFPIVESLSCGTPVLFGDNSSQPEVAGEAGLPTDPNNVEEIAANMKEILTNRSLYNSLKSKCIEQSMKFSWRDNALHTIDLYRSIIEKNKKDQGENRDNS